MVNSPKQHQQILLNKTTITTRNTTTTTVSNFHLFYTNTRKISVPRNRIRYIKSRFWTKLIGGYGSGYDYSQYYGAATADPAAAASAIPSTDPSTSAAAAATAAAIPAMMMGMGMGYYGYYSCKSRNLFFIMIEIFLEIF